MEIYQSDPYFGYRKYATDLWGVSQNVQTMYPIGGCSDLRIMNSNPNWRLQCTKNQDASTAYRNRRHSFDPARCQADFLVRRKSDDAIISKSHDFAVTMGPLPNNYWDTTNATVRDIALSRLKRKLNNRTQSFNSLVPLAEMRDLRSTVRGLTSLTTNVVESLRDVKKRRFKDAWKRVSDIWLTYSFGARPMMADVQAIANSIDAYKNRFDSIDRLTGKHSMKWKSRLTDSGQSCAFGVVMNAVGDVTHEISYKFICGHKFLLTSANDYTAADHFGFSPPKLIPTLWEATAFSWVLDYFGTIGDFLDDTFSGTTGNSIYVVENKKYSWSSRVRNFYVPSHDPSYYLDWSIRKEDDAVCHYFEFFRTPLSALPGRVLRFRTLDEMGLHGVNKLLNLTSVLAGFSR